MSTTERPEWVARTLDKYVGKKESVSTLPELGRNMQAEVTRIQAVIDVVTRHSVKRTVPTVGTAGASVSRGSRSRC